MRIEQNPEQCSGFIVLASRAGMSVGLNVLLRFALRADVSRMTPPHHDPSMAPHVTARRAFVVMPHEVVRVLREDPNDHESKKHIDPSFHCASSV
jgi:hypothetical protein